MSENLRRPALRMLEPIRPQCSLQVLCNSWDQFTKFPSFRQRKFVSLNFLKFIRSDLQKYRGVLETRTRVRTESNRHNPDSNGQLSDTEANQQIDPAIRDQVDAKEGTNYPETGKRDLMPNHDSQGEGDDSIHQDSDSSVKLR